MQHPNAKPITESDPQAAMKAELQALEARRQQRRVADTKRSWAPTVLGGAAALAVGLNMFFQKKYEALVSIARHLRHAETSSDPNSMKEMLKNPKITDIYDRLSRKPGDIAKLAGTPVPLHRTFSTLFDRFTSNASISADPELSQAYEQYDGLVAREFRNVVDEKVVHTLHGRRILSLDWENMSRPDRSQALVFGAVSAVAAGALVYAGMHWLTRETKKEKAARNCDEAMAEEARKQGFAELTPSAHAAEIGDFRERLAASRLSPRGPVL